MSSLTIENYVKTIYALCQREGVDAASTGNIAQKLNVSPGSVTSMLKTLSESGLAQYTPYEGVRLTESGRALALRVLRRHRLIELFLSKTLDLNWDEVHEDAENMEHAVSDLLIDRIDQFLGFPETDPHGDPIPKADGTVSSTASTTLLELAVEQQFRLARVTEQNAEFLRYLTENGLDLGCEGRVVQHSAHGGTVTIELGGRQTTISRDAAAKLKVEIIVS